MWSRITLVVVASAAAVCPIAAQTRPVIDTVPPLRDAAFGAAFLVGAAAVSPFDSRLAIASQRPSVQHSTLLGHGATVFNNLGGPGTVILALGTYAGGLIAHDRDVAALGLHGGEALVISAAVGEVIKGFTGRARPFLNIHDPGDFRFGRGFTTAARTSFPSGHVTASFALAAVASAEASHRWPHAARWIIPVAYTAASLVGLARIQTNQHWTSDVLAGAGIGTATGLLVVHFNEAHDDNVAERALLPGSAH